MEGRGIDPHPRNTGTLRLAIETRPCLVYLPTPTQDDFTTTLTVVMPSDTNLPSSVALYGQLSSK